MSEQTTTSIVIFGASGDLTRRKLIPGLFSLFEKERLPADFRIVGVSRTEFSHDEFRTRMQTGTAEFTADIYDDALWATFSERIFYIPGSINELSTYITLNSFLRTQEDITGEERAANRLYYLSTAPRFFLEAVTQLHAAGMLDEEGMWRRVIIEKPFGTDLASARELNRALHELLDEHQIYRIDHYLAKETVQNLLIFRFANAIFEPLWNRNFIDHVQITAIESVDVGRRAGYYDSAGVLRDMVQNHLLQLLSMVAMEPPTSFDADAVRDEKVKVLRAIRPIDTDTLAEQTVRAQYDGYLQAEGVAEGSTTPTFTALKLFIDNWRWNGVPFYLRSGKATATKTTEFIIQFKSPPHVMFPVSSDHEVRANYLAICIQPHEGIHLRFEAKVPDTQADMRSVDMEFHYDDSFDDIVIPEAYERLLMEAIQGDATLFTRADGIEASWRFIDKILSGFAGPAAPPVDSYPPGSWGPESADRLLEKDGRVWIHGCAEHD